jgi:hypothetical protein
LKSVNVFHYNQIPRNGQGLNSAKLLKVKAGSSTSLLIGEFEDIDGKPYAMVVNKNLKSSVWFDIKFNDNPSDTIMVINQTKQQPSVFGVAHKWLAPGYGILLTVK